MPVTASVHLSHNEAVPEPEKYLTVQEVADRYGVSKLVIYRKLAAHEIPGINIGRSDRRRKWRIKLSDLEAWERNRSSGVEEET